MPVEIRRVAYDHPDAQKLVDRVQEFYVERSGEPALGTEVTAEIKRMYVVPEAQGQGLAKRMLAHIEASARDSGFEAMLLTTGGLQHEAIGLYAANGYVDVEPFGYYKDDDLVVCMAKKL